MPTYHRHLRPRNRRSRRPRCTSTRPRCTPCSCTATARAGRAAGDSPPRPSRPRSPGAGRTAPSAGCSGECRDTAASSPHTLWGRSHAHTSPCAPQKPLLAPLSPLGPTYRSPARRSHPGSRQRRRTASCWKRSGRRHTATRGGPRHREHLRGQHTVSGISHSSGNNHGAPLCPGIRGGGSGTHPYALRGCPAQDVPPKPPQTSTLTHHTSRPSRWDTASLHRTARARGRSQPRRLPAGWQRTGGRRGLREEGEGGAQPCATPPLPHLVPGWGPPTLTPIPTAPSPSHGLGGPRGAAGGRRG